MENQQIKPGPVKKKLRLIDLLKIAREWRRQGYTGSRPVIKVVNFIPARKIREVIAEFKKRKKKRYNFYRKRVQVRVRVKKAGVVVTMDGATARKGEDYIVYRDRGSLSVESSSCEGTLKSKNTLNVLTNLELEGRLPLVFCTDNGSPFCSSEVENYLSTNYIVHLKSLPHVPQQNGSCENAVKEFKELLQEGFTATESCKILNESRKRQSIGYRTAKEFDQENFRSYTEEDRKHFYTKANQAIEMAKLGIKSVYEKRKAEREAIFQTMERFELITRTRGGQLYSPEPEDNT